jgi:hypothetical protein
MGGLKGYHDDRCVTMGPPLSSLRRYPDRTAQTRGKNRISFTFRLYDRADLVPNDRAQSRQFDEIWTGLPGKCGRISLYNIFQADMTLRQ